MIIHAATRHPSQRCPRDEAFCLQAERLGRLIVSGAFPAPVELADQRSGERAAVHRQLATDADRGLQPQRVAIVADRHDAVPDLVLPIAAADQQRMGKAALQAAQPRRTRIESRHVVDQKMDAAARMRHEHRAHRIDQPHVAEGKHRRVRRRHAKLQPHAADQLQQRGLQFSA